MSRKASKNNGLNWRTIGLFSFLIILTSVQGFSPVTASDEDVWQGRPTMQTKRYGHAAAVVNGKIYAFGGWNDVEELLATVEEYDPATERWRPRASMPTPRALFAAAVVNDRVYIIGGRDGTEVPAIATVEEYDPSTDTWRPRASMPTPRRSHAAAAVGERIYVIGGWDETEVFDIVEEYDPSTDTWLPRTPMPTPRVGLTATAMNGLIYAIGGSEEPDPWGVEELATVEEYDPATNSWRGLPPMPTNRWILSATTVGGRLYAIGGQRDYVLRENMTSHFIDESFPTVEEYNPATYTWQTRANMTTGRWSFAAVEVGGKIYVLGGINEYDWLSTMEAYDPPFYDTDEDGLADKDELGSYGTNPFSSDTDGDGLTDGAEVDAYRTNPVLADATVDTDGDGLTNVAEVDTYGTDPVLEDATADTDGDGLTNVAEVDTYGTDPVDPDTDGDEVNDGDEVDAGTDPTDPGDTPPADTVTVPVPVTVTVDDEGVFIPGFKTLSTLLGLFVLLLMFRERRKEK